MRGEGISTPHIHRTRWEPFSQCVFVCVLKKVLTSKSRDETEKGFYFYIFELARDIASCAYVLPRAMGKSEFRSSSRKRSSWLGCF